MSSATDLQPGFMLIQGNRLESLGGVLTAWLRASPLPALTNDVILVQSNGIGQWLKLALASAPAEDGGGLGIAAALDLLLPARFLWRLYRALLGDLPDTSAYDRGPLTWRLYALLGDLDARDVPAAWLDAPRGFLNADQNPRRRYQLALRLADLFDQYQVYRPDWLAAWAGGKDVLILPSGATKPVPERHRWQPLLWRRLTEQCLAPGLAPGLVPGEASRADIHQRFLARAQALQNLPSRPRGLPARVIIFGVSALPRQAIEALHAISGVTQVMLFVQNPCRHYWGDLIEGRELFRSAYRRRAARKVAAAPDPDALHVQGHPLLAAWGKQGRDYIRLLDAFDQPGCYQSAFADRSLAIDLFESPGQRCLLHQLQDDILELRAPGEARPFDVRIDPSKDASLRFFIAHGPRREIEILHDLLLDAFAAAEAACAPLAPRDVLVMVPAIETYAPHIEAVFGRLATDDPRFIPFGISDRGERQRNAMLLGLERLLRLPEGRCTVTEVLDLLDIPALRARFGLHEADLPALRQWISGAGVRWGLDAGHRHALIQQGSGLPAGLHQNTWRFGLERMLLGVASGAGAPWQGIEPYDEVGGLEAARIGPLAELIERLAWLWQELQQPRTPPLWNLAIANLLNDCFLADSDEDRRALSLVREALEHWTLECERGGLAEQPIPLEVVRDALLAGLDAPGLNRRFLVGAVNFATLMPMRAVPFRQIWLLGMNDGEFPRTRRQADFDLMAGDYRPGDRSRREDDRYLFLEALVSARERLSIGWVGRSQRDNSARPPSVLVGQLRDHIAAVWRLADGKDGASGERLLAALTTEHPLQPFSRRYFLADRAADLFTYAAEWTPGSAHDLAARECPPVLGAPRFEAPIRCADLGRFLRHPLRVFYAQRLGVYWNQHDEPSLDEEPFDFDALARYGLYDAVLGDTLARLAAGDSGENPLGQAIARRARAGELPIAPFDAAWCEQLDAALAAPVASYVDLLRAYPRQHQPGDDLYPGDLLLSDGDLILDDSPDPLASPIRVSDTGERLRPLLQASRLHDERMIKWHALIRHWPAHLAAQRQGPTRTLLLGPESAVALLPLDWAQAQTHLIDLLRGYRQGLSEALPLACKSAFAALTNQADARLTYEGGNAHAGENTEHPGYQRFWPEYAELVRDGRFMALAKQLYAPLVDHAEVPA